MTIIKERKKTLESEKKLVNGKARAIDTQDSTETQDSTDTSKLSFFSLISEKNQYKGISTVKLGSHQKMIINISFTTIFLYFSWSTYLYHLENEFGFQQAKLPKMLCLDFGFFYGAIFVFQTWTGVNSNLDTSTSRDFILLFQKRFLNLPTFQRHLLRFPFFLLFFGNLCLLFHTDKDTFLRIFVMFFSFILSFIL